MTITEFETNDDLIVEASGEGTDAAYAVSGYVLRAEVEVETLSAIDPASTQDMDLTGNEFGNTLIGNAGGNTLIGGGGADVLAGGGGRDYYQSRRPPTKCSNMPAAVQFGLCNDQLRAAGGL